MRLPRWIQRRLRQKPQVYLVPTIEGLWWIGTVVLLMVMGWGYTNNLCLAMAMILLAATVVLLMEAHFNLDTLRPCTLVVEDQFAGEPTRVQVWWTSKSKRLRKKLRLRWDGPGPESEEFNVGEAISWRFPKRGKWQATHVIVSSTYPLGLFRAWSYHKVSVEAWVYPERAPGPVGIAWLESGEGEAQTQESLSGDEPGDFRRYQLGDSPTRVAWKVLARGLPAHTKTYLSESQRQFHYAWPMGGEAEESLRRLSSVIAKHAELGEAWALRVRNQEFPLGSGVLQRQKCLRALAEAQ